MKTHGTRIFLLLLPLLVLTGTRLFAAEGELNRLDENGMRQGYWIVKGYMSDEPGYGANTTVEEGHYVDNQKEGLWKHYYPSGTLRSEITYQKNQPYGPYKVFYPNGQLEESSNWQRNKNVGIFERYYENGNLQQKFQFADNGKRNGLQEYFHENGQLALTVEVVNGKEEGSMKRYNEAGKLTETKVLNGGELKAGSVRKYGNSKALPKPAVKETIAAEPPAETEQPNDAFRFEPNGHNILYNKAQQITQVGNFRNGRLWDGKWYRYNPNGILVRIEIYKGGQYIGTGVIEEKH